METIPVTPRRPRPARDGEQLAGHSKHIRSRDQYPPVWAVGAAEHNEKYESKLLQQPNCVSRCVREEFTKEPHTNAPNCLLSFVGGQVVQLMLSYKRENIRRERDSFWGLLSVPLALVGRGRT